MKHHATTFATAAATILLASACTTEIVDIDPVIPENNLVQQHEVSDCGGFPQAMDADDGPAYCDAEMLHWSYDPATEKLSLVNSRVELNCCGEHSMVIEEHMNVYTVTETDAPEMIGLGEGARCGCTCVFDFALSAEGIAERLIQLRLERDVTDQGPVQTVLDVTIDLSELGGSIVVDDSESFWCEPDSVS